MPTFEILCATMHQTDFSKVKEMGLQSDVVFANQCDRTDYAEYEFDGHKAKMISTATRGVGKNRNFALMYAQADICLMADDDFAYVDGYEQIILQAFKELPQADCIVFNIGQPETFANRRYNVKSKRVRWYNALNYGTVRLAVRRTSIAREGISFNTNFGGGTTYSSGEDTLFICSMLKSGLKMYTYPVAIAMPIEDNSTWFKGYTEKFFYDKGALFGAVSRLFAKPLCLQYLVRHKGYKKGNMSFKKAYALMCQGAKGQKTLKAYTQPETPGQ